MIPISSLLNAAIVVHEDTKRRGGRELEGGFEIEGRV